MRIGGAEDRMRKEIGFLALGFVGLLLGAGAPKAPDGASASVHSQIVGTWELVSTEDRLSDGSTRAYPDAGPHGKGLLMYGADGRMCAQLMNPDRPHWKDANHPSDAEKISAFDGFSAYCGSYEVDEQRKTIYHFPETAWMPSIVGTKQRRPFTLHGDLLTFADKVTDEPGVESYVIVWRKLRDTAR